MDVVALTMTLLGACLPSLMKLVDKAAEGAGSKIGADAWEAAKKVWEKLYPKIAEKEDAKIAAERFAAQPESVGRKAYFQEELEKLFSENPDVEEAIAQILNKQPLPTDSAPIHQQIGQVEGQVVGQMTGGVSIGKIHADKVIGEISGDIEGGVNL